MGKAKTAGKLASWIPMPNAAAEKRAKALPGRKIRREARKSKARGKPPSAPIAYPEGSMGPLYWAEALSNIDLVHGANAAKARRLEGELRTALRKGEIKILVPSRLVAPSGAAKVLPATQRRRTGRTLQLVEAGRLAIDAASFFTWWERRFPSIPPFDWGSAVSVVRTFEQWRPRRPLGARVRHVIGLLESSNTAARDIPVERTIERGLRARDLADDDFFPEGDSTTPSTVPVLRLRRRD